MSDPITAPRILVADDDSLIRELLSEVLSARGAIVTLAEDGEAALREAVLAPFDLCILDCEMPKLSGLEACPRIIASACTRNLPILFLTGHNDDAIIQQAFDAGASDFLAKPVHLELLWRRITNLLSLAQMRKERENLKALLKLSVTPDNFEAK